jgi:hypothetical protein
MFAQQKTPNPADGPKQQSRTLEEYWLLLLMK